MTLSTRLLTEADDLEAIVTDINEAQWDAENDMADYDVESLRHYLNQQDKLFAVCYQSQDSGQVLAGVASASVQCKPYDKMRWLYVDEVDAAVNFRQLGVGTALMSLLLAYSEKNNFDEVWLGTEGDNVAANKLYQSIGPDHVDEVVGYTYEMR